MHLDLDYFNNIGETYNVEIDLEFRKWVPSSRYLAITIRNGNRCIKHVFDIPNVDNVHIPTVINDMLEKLGVKEVT